MIKQKVFLEKPAQWYNAFTLGDRNFFLHRAVITVVYHFLMYTEQANQNQVFTLTVV